jgi:hypothetical protein
MVAVWVKYVPGVPGSNTCLFVSETVADSWTTPQVVDSFPNYELGYSTAVAVLNDSQVMAAWNCCYDGWNIDVFSSVRTRDTWSEPVPIVAPEPSVDGNPYLCVSPSGCVRAVWQKELDVYTARYDGTNWVEPLMLADAASSAGYCTDELGRIWVVYDAYVGSSTYQTTVRYFDGQNWSDTSVVVVNDLGGGARIAVAHGRVWVVWLNRISHQKCLLYYSSANASGISETDVRFTGSSRVLRAAPNPFHRSTRITLTGGKWLSVSLCDAAGRRIRTLTDGLAEPGEREFYWAPPREADGTGQGVFFVRGTTEDGKTQTLKLIRVR